MSFIDYYEILGIGFNGDASEIKAAYRKLVKKFHPDLHPNNPEATAKMQLINEAYLILSDTEARQLYNREWARFYSYEKSENKTNETSDSKNRNSNADEFQFEDEKLRSWMDSAKRQARDITRQAVKDAGGILKDAGYAAAMSIPRLIIYIVIVNILFLLFKCSN